MFQWNFISPSPERTYPSSAQPKLFRHNSSYVSRPAPLLRLISRLRLSIHRLHIMLNSRVAKTLQVKRSP